MNQNTMLRPALIGGVLLGILSAIPPLSLGNCLCCAWIIGGGVLAAHLYVKSSPTVVTLGSGVALGLFTGAIGGIVSALFSIPVQMLMSSMLAEYTGQARQMLGDLPNLPPAVRELIMSTTSGRLSILSVIVAGFFDLVVYSIIAMLGGVLGVAIFEKRKIGGPPPTYQPPLNIPPPPPPPINPPEQ
jgi:hypothetical protein